MSDLAFRKRLLADPAGTLKGAGVEVPEGVTIEVVEDTATKVHLVLPAREDVTLDSDLEAAVGGRQGCGGGGGWACPTASTLCLTGTVNQ